MAQKREMPAICVIPGMQLLYTSHNSLKINPPREQRQGVVVKRGLLSVRWQALEAPFLHAREYGHNIVS